MAVISILSGDVELHDFDENNQGRMVWKGSATSTRSWNEVYSAALKEMDNAGNMDQGVPIEAVTPTQYRLVNQWFVDDATVEHFTGGSAFSQGWKDGTTEHILIIGVDFATAFTVHDIGRTVLGATTGDTGTLLDFNTLRGLVWIRPDVPTTGGDEFDHPSEAYSIQNDTAAQVWQENNNAGPSYVSMTTEFNGATDADLIPFPATDESNDAFQIGFSQPFSKLIFDYGSGSAVAGIGGTVAWEYFNGATWTDLAETDATNGFTTAKADGLAVTWAAPTNWAKTSINGSAQLYYVRARITGTYATNPILDQGFIAGQGAGNFQKHSRHGGASAAGESAWAGTTSIGAIQDNTKPYIFRENPDSPQGSFDEVKVVATKGTDSWWPQAGHLDICLKTKEADSIFGPNPDNTSLAIATFLMRQYSKTFSHFIGKSLATAGGETVVPFGTDDDLNNTTGHRRFTTDAETGAGWGAGDLDTVIREVGNTNNKAVITAISGTGPNYTVDYYLIGTQEDFVDNDVVENVAATKSMTLNVNASNVGPASLAVNPVFGATTQDINNGNGVRPYSIRFDPASNELADIFERQKYLTRRGSTAAMQAQTGEEYVGSELQIEYNTQASGNFVEGAKVYDQTTEAQGIVVADHDDGATGDLIIKALRGTFTAANVVSDSPDPTQTLGTALRVDASPFAIVNETTDATSAGGADVLPFPAAEAVGDYFVIGGLKPFSLVTIDIATAGTDGVGLWEYWSGTAWTSLEAVSGFVDGTNDLKSGTGNQTLSFYPPVDWQRHTLVDGTASYGPFYMIRLRVTTVYTVDPILDQVSIADFVTATIGSVRTIVPIAAAPFGTFAGGKFFGAPGVTLTIANLAAGEDQSYQLIDDNGVTQIPPNTITFEVDNLISGDFVACYRRTGAAINKTQFVLAASNDLGDAAVIMNATIPTDNPTNANSKVRILSLSGDEHRYRYTTYATTTFALATATVGTDDGTGTLTTIDDAGVNFVTDGVEPGDMVRNTTDGVSFSVVVTVAATQLVVTSNGVTWASKAYSVNTLVENYGAGQNAYVPIIEQLADAAFENNKLVLATSITARVVVRRSSAATEILPFTADITIAGSQTTTTIRNTDSIIT
jgi:hypothetical protein